ncbi:LuxR C-terminal-related transcriptional regulator [Actinoplanes sp. CA-142083]|uniref:LuxR C-terminal-related transcriptional regulator n=1 Tax=Actinoplanes sp. CA-142083 TaxID=3239903 RepID=UPI003D8ED9CE
MRVLVVGDVAIHVAALAEALARRAECEAVSTASDPETALRRAADGAPTAVLVDLAMHHSLPVIRRLSAVAPVVVTAMTDADEVIIACAEAGASGFLFREQPLAELIVLLQTVAWGEPRHAPCIAASLLRHVARSRPVVRPAEPAVPLTPREREVLELVDQGLSNKQIARRLVIELRTVKNHVHHILEKYQVHRRAEAADRYRAGIP